jgi:hypothetical protein
MALRIDIRSYGAKELENLFKRMPLDFQDKIFKEAHRRALKPTLEKASSLAPVQNAAERAYKTRFDSGGVRTVPLRDSIKTVSGGSPQRTGEIGLVRAGALRRKPYRAFHAALVEFGSRGIRKAGGWYAKLGFKTQKPMPRKAFMRPAWEDTKDQVLNSIAGFITQRVNGRIRKEVRRSYK